MVRRSKQVLLLALTVALTGLVAPLAVAAPGIDGTPAIAADTGDSTSAIVVPEKRDGGDHDGDDGDEAPLCGGPETLIIVSIPNLLCLEVPPS